jgi:hypothetical protein
MNARQVQGVLNTIECDGWDLTAIEDPFHGVRFRAVKTNIPDNFGTGTIDKGIGPVVMRLPQNPTPGDVVWWVWKRLEEDAIHELREKFIVAGKAIFNPHAEEEPAQLRKAKAQGHCCSGGPYAGGHAITCPTLT